MPVASARRSCSMALSKRGYDLRCMIGHPSDCGIDLPCAKQGTWPWATCKVMRCGHRTWISGGATEPGSELDIHTIIGLESPPYKTTYNERQYETETHSAATASQCPVSSVYKTAFQPLSWNRQLALPCDVQSVDNACRALARSYSFQRDGASSVSWLSTHAKAVLQHHGPTVEHNPLARKLFFLLLRNLVSARQRLSRNHMVAKSQRMTDTRWPGAD